MIRSLVGELPVRLTDMPVAEWAAAVVVRHSARTYTGHAVDPALLDRLERFCGCLPGVDVARVALVRDVPDAVFTGIVGSYGRVLGAPSALLLIGTEAEPAVQESLGYLGKLCSLRLLHWAWGPAGSRASSIVRWLRLSYPWRRANECLPSPLSALPRHGPARGSEC
jgi:hypothetical protein